MVGETGTTRRHVLPQWITSGVAAALSRVPPHIRWTVIDQGISSASNLFLVASVARSSGVGEFGAFSLASIACGLLLGAGRAIGGDILLLRAEQHRANLTRDTRRLLGLALALGAFGGIVVCSIAPWAGGTKSGLVFAVGASLPILLLQDALRYCLFARRTPAQAAVNDMIWLAVQVVATVSLLYAVPLAGPASIVLAWALGGAVAVVVGLWQARLIPTWQGLATWFTQDRARVGTFFGDFVLLTGAGYASIYLIALIGGVEEVAAVRGAVLLFAPLDALFLGVRVVTLPALARSIGPGGSGLRQRARLVAVLSGALAVTWAAAALSLPDWLGRALLGPSWVVVTPLIAPIAIALTARYIAIPSQAGLRALGETRRIVGLRAIITLLVLGGVVVGTPPWGALGAAIGLAVAYLTEVILSWGTFLASSRLSPGFSGQPASEPV
jgi:O-antigen/teichoic acid export membrane protein